MLRLILLTRVLGLLVYTASVILFFQCIGFMWQGVGSRVAAGVASVRKDQGLSPCRTETVPDSSKMHVPLAKAESISESGDASVITYLRKGEKMLGSSCERQE